MKTSVLASSLFLFIGCGSDDGETVTYDAGANFDAALSAHPRCDGLLPSYDLSDASFVGYARPRDPADSTSPTVYGMTATLDSGPPTDLFEIQLWDGLGAFSGGVAPGTISIEGAETDLNECGFCALMFGDLSANGSTSMVLVAQSGTFTIDDVGLEAGARFRGSAPIVEYRQVNSSGVILDGCGLTITNVDFDVTLDP